jgi:hypothetical protein
VSTDNTDDFDVVALGWRQDLEDYGAHAALPRFLIPPAYQRPEELDPSDRIPVYNQGKVGSCAGHGTTCAGDTCEWLQTAGKLFQHHSPAYSYYTGQKLAGITADEGCTIDAVAKAASEDYGLCLNDDCPYQPIYDPSCVTPEIIEKGRKRKFRRNVQLRTIEEMLNWLGTGQGAIINGFWWYESFAKFDTDGYIREISGQKLGGHCTCFFGYNREGFRHRNSHGPRWSKQGTATMALDVVTELFTDKFTIFRGVSDIDVPEDGPKRVDFVKNNIW